MLLASYVSKMAHSPWDIWLERKNLRLSKKQTYYVCNRDAMRYLKSHLGHLRFLIMAYTHIENSFNRYFFVMPLFFKSHKWRPSWYVMREWIIFKHGMLWFLRLIVCVKFWWVVRYSKINQKVQFLHYMTLFSSLW